MRVPKRKGTIEGDGYCFYNQSCLKMPQCADASVALTVTSPPYWNAIDYDTHAQSGNGQWYRQRKYESFGETFDCWLTNINKVFTEVYRVTVAGGFCAIVVGTILHKRKHYPAPMLVTANLIKLGWAFHQDIIWNKVTGGVKRAGSFIQNPKLGYYYPNIMTEYILIFRKPGDPRRGTQKALAIDELFKRDIANNVWHIAPIPPRSIDHPCPYPEEIVRRLVLLYSDRNDKVLDPFLGSGQTAIAARREGRVCVGYDTELKYVQLAEARLHASQSTRKYNLIPHWNKIETPG